MANLRIVMRLMLIMLFKRISIPGYRGQEVTMEDGALRTIFTWSR